MKNDYELAKYLEGRPSNNKNSRNEQKFNNNTVDDSYSANEESG